jgi:hypothetical protein
MGHVCFPFCKPVSGARGSNWKEVECRVVEGITEECVLGHKPWASERVRTPVGDRWMLGLFGTAPRDGQVWVNWGSRISSWAIFVCSLREDEGREDQVRAFPPIRDKTAYGWGTLVTRRLGVSGQRLRKLCPSRPDPTGGRLCSAQEECRKQARSHHPSCFSPTNGARDSFAHSSVP